MTKAALARRLVLLAAPAGFGKTAALARLIERLRGKASVAWISADVDDDPLGLLACLIAALEPLDPPWRTDPEALIAAAGGSRSDRHDVVTQVLNALAACDVERGLIVLDDAHRVSDADRVRVPRPPARALAAAVGRRRREPDRSAAGVAGAAARARRARRVPPARAALHPRRGARAAAGRRRGAALDHEATSERLYQRTHGWAVGLRLAVNGIRLRPRRAGGDRRHRQRSPRLRLPAERSARRAAGAAALLPAALLGARRAHRRPLRRRQRRSARRRAGSRRSSGAACSSRCCRAPRRRCACTTCSAISCATACAARWPTSCRRCTGAPPRARPTCCAGSAS